MSEEQLDRKGPPRLSFRLPLDPARLLRARERMRDYLYEHGVRGDDLDDVVLAIEEAMTNAVRHSGAERDLEVDLRFDGGDLLARIRDHGKGFAVESFDRDAVPDLLAPGGRGLYLIARLMDEIELRRNGGLEVCAVKRHAVTCDDADGLPAAPGPDWLPGSRGYQEARQRQMLDEVGEAFVALDWEYRIAHVNARAAGIARSERDELVGRPLVDVFPRLYESAPGRAIRDAMEFGTSSLVEYQGLQGWSEVRVYASSSGASLFISDINQRKREQLERDELYKALRDSEQRYRELFQSESDALLLIEHETGRVLEANQAAEAMYGYSTEELLALRDLDLTAEPEATRTATTAAETDANATVPLRLHRRKDGSTFLVDITGRAFTLQGRVVRVAAVRDVSERHRTELALRDSEQRYRSIVETTAEGVAVATPDGAITYANERMAELLGCAVDELQGMNGSDLLFDDREAWATRQRATLHAGEGVRGEVKLRRKDGSALWTLFSSVPMFGAGGEHTGNLTMHADITKRKAAEEALETIRFQLSEAQRIAHVGSFEWDAETQATVWSDEECRIYGLPPGSPSPSYDVMLERFIHPDDAALLHETFATAVAAHGIYELEHRIVRPDGAVRILLDRAHPHFDERGKLVRYVGASVDVTELRRAEADLEQRSRLLDLSSDAVLAWRLHGAIEYWNQGAQSLYGYAAHDAVGRVSHDLLGTTFPNDLESIVDALERAGEWSGEMVHIARDGRRITVDSRMKLVGDREPRLVLETNRDITDRKRAEEALRESEVFATTMARIDELLHSSLDAEKIIARALEEGGKALAAETAAVMPHERGAFVARYIWNWPPEALGTIVTEAKDTHGLLALETRKPVAIDDTSTDVRVHRGHMDDWSIKSVIAVPLFLRGEPYAVAYFDYITHTHHFADAEIAFATRLGSSLSTALENARLYEEQRHIATTLQQSFMHPIPSVPHLEFGTAAATATALELVGGDSAR
jgi:PAS domain S-box-containing protein